MSERSINWNEWLNKLIFCHGCGRFSMPRNGKPPKGWKLLYQPHPEGRPGLYACSPDCGEKLREKMKEGPIVEPLEMKPLLMPHEFQEQVRELIKDAMEEEKLRELMEGEKLQRSIEEEREKLREVREKEDREKEAWNKKSPMT